MPSIKTIIFEFLDCAPPILKVLIGAAHQRTPLAMNTASFQENIQGFSIAGLRNDALEIRVIPTLGGKICSIVSRKTKREWMWRPPGDWDLFTNPFGDDFNNSTIVGADECIPTISECVWHSHTYPDHGEAWSLSWTLHEKALLEQQRLICRVTLPTSGLELEREITLKDQSIQFQYRLSNPTEGKLNYLWAWHPLFTLQEGDRLVLPEKCDRVTVTASLNCGMDSAPATVAWPSPNPQLRFNEFHLGDNTQSRIKLFTPPLTEGRALIQNSRTGDQLEIHFNPAHNPFLGVWINRGGWNNFHNFAVEPTNMNTDSLTGAPASAQNQILAGATKEWKVELKVS